METKKYTSFAEIDLDLKIIEIEKEIRYYKLLKSIDNVKESIFPTKAITLLTNLYDNVFSGTYGTIIKTIVPFGIKWFMNRKKRGD